MGHYERISVGDKIKELATNEIMIRMSFDSSVGWKLVVGFPEMRKEENDAFIYGDLLAAFTVVMDTPFFLFSFGGGPWMDTPFEPRIDASLPSFDIRGHQPSYSWTTSTSGASKRLSLYSVMSFLTSRIDVTSEVSSCAPAHFFSKSISV